MSAGLACLDLVCDISYDTNGIERPTNVKKVVITAEPNYLARFTSTNQVISYQRRFMNAANGEK